MGIFLAAGWQASRLFLGGRTAFLGGLEAVLAGLSLNRILYSKDSLLPSSRKSPKYDT